MPGCCLGDDGGHYTTQEGLLSQDLVLKDMELHIAMAHTHYHGLGEHGGDGGVHEAANDIKTHKRKKS